MQFQVLQTVKQFRDNSFLFSIIWITVKFRHRWTKIRLFPFIIFAMIYFLELNMREEVLRLVTRATGPCY